MIRRSNVCIRSILGLTIMVDEIVCRDCMQVFYDWRDADNHVCNSPIQTQATVRSMNEADPWARESQA